jgi:hypothetical protein
LEKRIESFITASTNLVSQYPDTEAYVANKNQSLRDRWSELLLLIKEHKTKMDLAVKYYHLIEVVSIKQA